VKNMIDKAIAEHSSSPKPSGYMGPPLESSTSKSVFAEVRTARDYTYPRFAASYDQPAQSAQLPPPTMQPQPALMQNVPPTHSQAPCWDDFNLSNINNIAGDVLPNADVIPEFDFVSANGSGVVDDDVSADQSRVSGVIPSTTQPSLPPWRYRTAIFLGGSDEF